MPRVRVRVWHGRIALTRARGHGMRVGHRRALHLLHDLRRRARSRPAHTREAPAAQPTRSLTRPSRALAPVDTRAARALPARGWQVRNQYFYLDDAILAQFPQAASFIVTTFVIVELSSPGTEAISYGVLSSASLRFKPTGRRRMSKSSSSTSFMESAPVRHVRWRQVHELSRPVLEERPTVGV